MDDLEDVLLDELMTEDELEEATDDVDDVLIEELVDDTAELEEKVELEEELLTDVLEIELLSLETPASPPEQAASSKVLSVVATSAKCDERHKVDGEKKEWDMVLDLFRN